MEEEKKSYYAVIPANVRYDKRLKLLSRFVYGEITALCNEKGYCWATNRYFADLYGVSIQTISSCINQLKEFDYIEIELIYKEGGKEILYRYIKLFTYPIKENLHRPIKEIFKDNITYSNNTSNNSIYAKEEDKYTQTSMDTIKDLYNSICVNLPKVIALSSKRKTKLKLRMEKLTKIENWQLLFEKANKSSFLTGNNNRNWQANFDWLIENDTNYLKVLEGKYDNQEQKQEIIKWEY